MSDTNRQSLEPSNLYGVVHDNLNGQHDDMRMRLREMLQVAGVSDMALEMTILGIIQGNPVENKALRRIRAVLGKTPEPITLLEDRASFLMKQAMEYIRGDRILDFMCGEGNATLILNRGFCMLYDTCNRLGRRAQGSVGAESRYFTDKWEHIERIVHHRGLFDTTFTLAALQRSADPLLDLSRLHDTTSRLVIIVPVISTTNSYEVLAFVEWFSNKVLLGRDPTPSWTMTINEWRAIVDDSGFGRLEEQDLGEGPLLSPGHFWLFVCAKA